MLDGVEDLANRHRQVCTAFGDAVSTVGDHWRARSPCSEWDARGVLEHVIGFHDVLLLRPLATKPQRPKDDPVGRWAATYSALDQVLSRPGLFDGVVDVPAVGNHPASRLDAIHIVPLLSLDVLVHTWDLARAAGHEVNLDPEPSALFLSRLPTGNEALAKTGMYDSPWDVPDDADAQTKLLARLGRNPRWSPFVF